MCGCQLVWHTGLVVVAHGLESVGWVVVVQGLSWSQHVGSSQARDRIHVPCIGRRILIHCATREAPCGISKRASHKDPPCQLPGKIKECILEEIIPKDWGKKMPPESVESALPGQDAVNHGVFVLGVLFPCTEVPAICACYTAYQAGFRKGRGTRDQVANIRWIIEKAREFQKNISFCFIDYAKAFDCVNHNKLWKILKEMGIPDHLICLLRNLYAGQEATVRTGHGTTVWFQIGKGVTLRLYIVTLLI